MPAIPFPTTTGLGSDPSAAGGRLINCLAERAPEGSRGEVRWRRVPGLASRFTTGSEGAVRGAGVVGSVIYVVVDDAAFSVVETSGSYTVTELSGTVSGTGPVIIARNNKTPTPQILIWTSDGQHEISGSTVSSFSDPDLPANLSLTFLDGYFIWATASGQLYASGLNALTVASTDFTTAEASPDGLVRAVAKGRYLVAFGETTTEIYANTGNETGFPFSRAHVEQIGLKAKWAVAGFEPGFPGPLIFVGNDDAVHRFDGYSATPISTPEIDRLIAAQDGDDLRASVYVTPGHMAWVLSSPSWTLVYDLKTGAWHERASHQRDDWRCRYGIEFDGEWLTFDTATRECFAVTESAKKEGTDPLTMDLRSSKVHRFPKALRFRDMEFDFLMGVGDPTGEDPIETDPSVQISWSDDGGVTFSPEVLRNLGDWGDQDRRVRIKRGGKSGPRGRQFRIVMSDPVDAIVMGGAYEFEELMR